ncbi:alpha/beta-type small acid-soluble spore protein [Fonticella tunisiensis]|uniref:Small acid-soluble spore protein alpha/beta type n=1 Tax=Fonticella tunisiensis TaxID=1096341 RepID=A0A4R7KPX8_9CLOT|nr:alpha/beta-type small acid-soluble spore protein [Fonticella tunisiensis]TDT61075.1 small acid-soluble spore protein alpha/beta type [Fonticella tunisiensis]
MAAGQRGSGRTQLVPEAHSLLDNMKYEIAAEFAIPVHQGSEDYWGNITSRDCGRVGGTMVKRLVHLAEKQILQGNRPEKI